MPTIHHLKSKREKKDLSCQLLGKHRLLWKEKGRRRDTEIDPTEVCRLRGAGGETGKSRKRKPGERGGEEEGR